MPNKPFPATGSMENIKNNVQDYIDTYYYLHKKAVETLWNYWMGNQAPFLPKYKGESDDEWMERKNKAPIENHCRPTSNINVSFMYGIYDKIARRAENQELHKLLHDDVYDINEMSALMIDNRLETSVSGYSVMELKPINKNTRKPFISSEEITKENFTVLYTLNDSALIVPFPRNYDKRSLGSIIKTYLLENVDEYLALGLVPDSNGNVRIVEYIDDDHWYRWATIDEKKESEWIPLTVFANNPGVNIYGDVRIPFVIFKNIGDPMEIVGDSDIADIIPLQNMLNERNSDDAIVMEYHSMPLLAFLKGAKIPKNFIRKPNSAIEFDGEGDAKYLTWDDKLEASTQFKKDVRQGIREVTQVSGLARGNMQEIGQLKTGIGVKSLFVPDIIGVRLRRPFMVKGEKDLIWATAKMYEFYAKYDFKNDYHCEIILPEDFLGIDELLETQVEQMKVGMGLPIREKLKEQNPDASDDELDSLEEEIKNKDKKPVRGNPTPEQKSLEKE